MPSKRKRALNLKIRVVITKRMRKSDAIKRVRRSIDTGIIQPGIELAWIDWRTGKGARAKAGQYVEGEALNALVQFHNAIVHPEMKVRIEVVGEGKE
jgi:hypothetical protein